MNHKTMTNWFLTGAAILIGLSFALPLPARPSAVDGVSGFADQQAGDFLANQTSAVAAEPIAAVDPKPKPDPVPEPKPMPEPQPKPKPKP